MGVSKEEKDLCTGVSKAHWKSFKLDLKGIKPGSLEVSLGVACQSLRDSMLVRFFSLLSQWR